MNEIIQKGLKNPSLEGLEQSATLLINEKVSQARSEGKKVYNLGLGQSPFPVPDSIVETLRNHAHEKSYLSVKGLPALREAVASFHRRHDGISAGHNQVMVGPGSKELLFLIQLCFQGEIFVPSPCWVSYIPQARILNKKISFVHTKYEDKWRILPDKLQEICDNRIDQDAPALLIINYPGNPDGITYNVQELQELAEVARRNNLIILSDEIYGLLHHEGGHTSISQFYPEGTIISSGLSKWCGAGGWRLGTFTFPHGLKWLQDAMAVVASETYTSVSAPIQYAAIEAFRSSGPVEEYLWHCRRILKRVGNETADILLNTGLKLHRPEGGFYHFVDFSPFREKLAQKGINNSIELCNKMMDEIGVATLPGYAFGRKREELTARMAYVDFDGARALANSQLYPLHHQLPDDFTRNYSRNPVTAMRKIKEWLS